MPRAIYIPNPFVYYDDVRHDIRVGLRFFGQEKIGHVRFDLARCRNYEISNTCEGFPDTIETGTASRMRNGVRERGVREGVESAEGMTADGWMGGQ